MTGYSGKRSVNQLVETARLRYLGYVDSRKSLHCFHEFLNAIEVIYKEDEAPRELSCPHHVVTKEQRPCSPEHMHYRYHDLTIRGQRLGPATRNNVVA
jgi:hypothetical protein